MTTGETHFYTQGQNDQAQEMLGTPEFNRSHALGGVWSALLGILGIWLAVGVLCGIGWLVYKYPETSLFVALAIVITFVGAMLGLTAKYGEVGDYWL